jgi:Na+/melibiose symporter-like transporter
VRGKTFICVSAIITTMLVLLSIWSLTITYPIDKDNCENLIRINYATTTSETANCIGLINHPFYNYYLEGIMASIIAIPLLCAVICMIIAAVYYGILEHDWEGDEIEKDEGWH